MQSRMSLPRAAPDAQQAVLALNAYVEGCGLEHSLLELVKTRASQINGCAFCLHMHVRDARKAGVSEDKLAVLPAWRESPLFSERERAALEWTEALTLIATNHVPDAVYEAARAQFSEAELGKLTVAIGLINTWNRIAIAFRYVHPA